MESHWIINIAELQPKPNWKGEPVYHHFFRVKVTGHNTPEFIRVLKSLTENYTAPQYSVSVTRWNISGLGTNVEELLNDQPCI